MNKLMFTVLRGKTVSVLVSESRVLRITAAPEKEEASLGTVCVGKVRSVVKNIHAAFVEYAPGVNGYYSLAENTSHLFLDGRPGDAPLRAGDEILVQISRAAVKTKDAVLTSKIALAGRCAALSLGGPELGISAKIRDGQWKKEKKSWWESCREEVLPSGSLPSAGFVLRTNAYGASDVEIKQEMIHLREKMERILRDGKNRTVYSILDQPENFFIRSAMDVPEDSTEEILTDLPEAFSALSGSSPIPVRFYEDDYPLTALFRLEAALSRALGKQVWLRSGGYLVIEPTEAMTVIDVNTGKNTGKKEAAETYFRTNLEAAEEIAAQLRLRNLSGIIVVDFIDMKETGQKEELLRRLRQYLAADPVKTVLVDMTPLGLVEITRKKLHQPLYEQFNGCSR